MIAYLVDGVDLGHAGVVQARQRARLALEPAQALLVVDEVRREDLDRYLASQPGILRPPDLAHRACIQGPEDRVVPQGLAGGQGRHGTESSGPGERECRVVCTSAPMREYASDGDTSEAGPFRAPDGRHPCSTPAPGRAALVPRWPWRWSWRTKTGPEREPTSLSPGIASAVLAWRCSANLMRPRMGFGRRVGEPASRRPREGGSQSPQAAFDRCSARSGAAGRRRDPRRRPSRRLPL